MPTVVGGISLRARRRPTIRSYSGTLCAEGDPTAFFWIPGLVLEWLTSPPESRGGVITNQRIGVLCALIGRRNTKYVMHPGGSGTMIPVRPASPPSYWDTVVHNLWRKDSACALETHMDIVSESGITKENRGPLHVRAYIVDVTVWSHSGHPTWGCIPRVPPETRFR